MTTLYHKLLQMAVCICITLSANAQTHLPVKATVGNNCGGYYEYLPGGYSNTKKYPLLIFLHGADNFGNGTNLLKLLNNGIPKVIADGMFPNSFVSGNQTFQFIVFSPQFKTWPVANDVQSLIDYAADKYSIDEDRIYLTGASMGGGIIWDYVGASAVNAGKVAAIVPVCGASEITDGKLQNIVDGKLPIWATHNKHDEIVDLSITTGYIEGINSLAPSVKPKMTIFDTTSHDAWTKTYSPAFKEGGLNIYEWMLLHTLNRTLPVTLSSYTAFQSGKFINVKWITTEEINHHSFILEKSIDAISFRAVDTIAASGNNNGSNYAFVDEQPYAGSNYYRLVSVDVNGKKENHHVLHVAFGGGINPVVLVYPNPVINDMIIKLRHPEEDELLITLHGMNGNYIKHWTIKKNAGEWNERISLPVLTRGNYIVKIKGNNTAYSQMLVKQ